MPDDRADASDAAPPEEHGVSRLRETLDTLPRHVADTVVRVCPGGGGYLD